MRFSVAVLLVVCLLFPFLTATHAQCMSTNTSSNITSSGGNSSQPIRANRTAEVQGNITNVPILPPFPTPSINSTSLGCPEENARQLMSTEEASRCPSNSTFPNITANATVAWQLPVTYRCYNKTTHSCVNGYFLCPANASSLCGVQCYDPANYTCYTTYSLCPQEAPLKCGESCFSSEQFSCEDGRLTSKNSTSGNSSSSGEEMRYSELNVFSLPIQPAARRLSTLRPHIN